MTMITNTLGIVFSNMHDEMLGELTEHRTTGSIPFGGRYRLIDFMLSNMVNSGISDIGIVTKNNYQSLMDHLGSGRDWDLSRKRGGMCILPPFGHSSTGMYRGRLEALSGVMSYIRHSNAQYVMLSDTDIVANIDLDDVMEQHQKSGADITVVYKCAQFPKDAPKDIAILNLDDSGRVSDVLVNSHSTGKQNIYLNIAIMRKELLEHLAIEGTARNNPSFTGFVLQERSRVLKIMGYEFQGFSSKVINMKDFFKTNMDLLNPAVREQLFFSERPIYTKVRDEVPVKYGLDSVVRNSMIADGCIIDGYVENSIIFRGVKIAKGAVVKNSIIMQSGVVGENAKLDYVVTDKDVFIDSGRILTGFETYPIFIAKGSRV